MTDNLSHERHWINAWLPWLLVLSLLAMPVVWIVVRVDPLRGYPKSFRGVSVDFMRRFGIGT